VKYRTIVADPPWPYGASDRGSMPGAAYTARRCVHRDFPYQTMTVDGIAAFDAQAFAADDCRLFLWTTNRHLRAGFVVLERWGFAYSLTLVWRKTGDPSPLGPAIAPIHTEYVLVGARGKPPASGRLPSNVLDLPRQRQHSQKPEAFFDLVEQVSPGPYLELFARRQRLGWDTWGNEALEHVELTA
jgi:N6-adenosine-specific RNA methylase IME4